MCRTRLQAGPGLCPSLGLPAPFLTVLPARLPPLTPLSDHRHGFRGPPTSSSLRELLFGGRPWPPPAARHVLWVRDLVPLGDPAVLSPSPSARGSLAALAGQEQPELFPWGLGGGQELYLAR